MIHVSVIITVYNGEAYIEQCLRSAMNQTLKSLEIIVINDGSEDNSSTIARRFAQTDSRIRVIDQINQGLSGARNSGIMHAQGKYIAFLDCDDWVDPDMYESLYREAEARQAQMCVSGLIYERGDGNTSQCLPPFDSALLERDQIETEFLPAVLSGRSVRNGNVFMSTAWLSVYNRQHVLDHSLSFFFNVRNEDTLFNLYMADTCTRIAILPRCMYHYRKNSGSMTEKYYRNLREMTNAGDPYIAPFQGRSPLLRQAFLDRKFVSMSTELKNIIAPGSPWTSLMDQAHAMRNCIQSKWKSELLDQADYAPKWRYQKWISMLARRNSFFFLALSYRLRSKLNRESVKN